jgi:hypothetical protein
MAQLNTHLGTFLDRLRGTTKNSKIADLLMEILILLLRNTKQMLNTSTTISMKLIDFIPKHTWLSSYNNHAFHWAVRFSKYTNDRNEKVRQNSKGARFESRPR